MYTILSIHLSGFFLTLNLINTSCLCTGRKRRVSVLLLYVFIIHCKELWHSHYTCYILQYDVIFSTAFSVLVAEMRSCNE